MPRYVKPVRLMIREAIEALGGTASYREIINYIRGKYGDVNENTIRCQIIICTVNAPSRVHYPENERPRICKDKRYDFLYRIAPGVVTFYNPEVHGLWAIVKEEGKLKIKRISESEAKQPLPAPYKPSPIEEIEDYDRVDRFVKVCIKLDELRFAGTIDWGSLARNIFHNPSLTASDRILLFWLCSAIDQFYPYEWIWTIGERAMLRIIERKPSRLSDLEDVIVDGRIINIDGNRFILVRDDLERIKNTVKFLLSYYEIDGSLSTKLVHFLGQLIEKFQGTNGTLKLAYYLNEHLWHGKPYTPPNPQVSMRELNKFINKSRKRLWMFLMFLRRDPAVMNLLKNALIEVYGEDKGNQLYNIWTSEEKFTTKQLQLPADMWNQRLFNTLLKTAIPGKITDAKKIARQLAQKYNISPTVFDVTFELGANKCRQKQCNQCPFGENQLCQQNIKETCPITKWLYPHYRKNPNTPKLKCQPKNCPIKQNKGKNLCTKTIDKTFRH